jgi:hypothetical protein
LDEGDIVSLTVSGGRNGNPVNRIFFLFSFGYYSGYTTSLQALRGRLQGT